MSDFSSILDSAEINGAELSFSVPSSWSQGRTVYGGMQSAFAVKAMLNLLEQNFPLRSLQVMFIGPVEPGVVTARAKVLRKGRTAIHIQAEIFQDDKINLTAIGIFGLSRESAIAEIPTAPNAVKNLEEADAMHFVSGIMPDFMQHFFIRNSEPLQWFSGAQHPRSSGYATHVDQTRQSWEHLVAIADIAPPVAMAALKKFAPASSMNWHLDFIQTAEQLSDQRWLRVETEMRAGIDGYCWQDTNFFDENGKLAMMSRQCLAVFG